MPIDGETTKPSKSTEIGGKRGKLGCKNAKPFEIGIDSKRPKVTLVNSLFFNSLFYCGSPC